MTPMFVIEAVREVLGRIDLDPASSAAANVRVGATRFFDGIERDGLKEDWHGRVFMNHPFSRAGNRKWIAKLAAEYASGRVTQACNITYVATSEVWFQPLIKRPQCFLYPRTQYILPDGTETKMVPKGSVVTYFGRTPKLFTRVFAKYGEVK